MGGYFNRNNLINDNFDEIGTMDKKELTEAEKRIRHRILCEMAQGICIIILGAISCWAICTLADALNI